MHFQTKGLFFGTIALSLSAHSEVYKMEENIIRLRLFFRIAKRSVT